MTLVWSLDLYSVTELADCNIGMNEGSYTWIKSWRINFYSEISLRKKTVSRYISKSSKFCLTTLTSCFNFCATQWLTPCLIIFMFKQQTYTLNSTRIWNEKDWEKIICLSLYIFHIRKLQNCLIFWLTSSTSLEHFKFF